MKFPKTPSFRLKGKRSLITGAGRGIGLGAAIALSEAGSEVVIISRTEKELKCLNDFLEDQGYKSKYKILDITKICDVENFIGNERPFDILVNNAGINIPSSFVDTNIKDYEKVMELNVNALINLTKLVVKKMLKNKIRGSIINVSSQMGHVGAIKRTTYCASKFAVEGFTKALSIELAEKKIRVNSICPTFIETSLTKEFLKNKKFKDYVLSMIPLKRLGKIEDIMGAFVFLASDASSLMTGTSLVLDGGWTAR
ncbi:MAG: 3-oxoacyl-ACP reductase [Rickettsiales bacterium]|nr:3-oxoacyl-ACP reductase [Rickettsiales bacterium]OUV54584.1 MAG: 3-oxoacyl-ACP reductase [Rickettsiales bacterium TMED127]|tara:strand:- start:60263 stop:61027 length:765 start_codon:yes stop_codon:yes gene_type:complete